MILEINRKYQSRGKEYILIKTGVKVVRDGKEEDGVAYNSTELAERGTEIVTTRPEFLEAFIPVDIRVGERIVAVSMGRIRDTYEVESTGDGYVVARNLIIKETKKFYPEIGSSAQMKLYEGETPEQATDYYFEAADGLTLDSNNEMLNKALELLDEAGERLGHINVWKADKFDVEYALESLRQTLEAIYRKFGV